jgi:2-iminobutanoate/2-iminopropanoate deaminase
MIKYITNIFGRPSKRKLPISSAVVAEGRFAFVSGQGPLDPETGEFVRGSITEQTRLTLHCVKRAVEASGGTLDQVVSVRVFLQPLTNETFAEMNAVFAEFFEETKPARTTIGAQLLNIDVEIDCIVRIP